MSLPFALESRLDAEEPEERRRAVAELSRSEPEFAAGPVVRALGDEDWRVRKEAVLVALALSPSRAVLERLVEALSHPDNVGLRNAAVEALGGFGESAVDALSAELRRLDADARKLAVEALGRTGQPSALAPLSSLLEDPDANVRVAATEAIAALGVSGVGGATELLERCLGSNEPLLALASLDGLNALGSALSWSALERCLGQPTLRRSALLAAGRSRDPRALAVLMQALAAARGRGLIEIACALRDLARDVDAVAALGAGGAHVATDSAGRLIALALDDQASDDARRAALVVVGLLRIEGAAACAVAVLGDDRFLAEAHEALALLGARAVPALVASARQGDAELRANCLSLLALIADESQAKSCLEPAREALEDESLDVQREALGVLARLGDAASLADVARSLTLRPSPATLKAAEGALGELAASYPVAARALADSAHAGDASAHAACVAIAAAARGGCSSDADLEFLCSALANPAADVRRAAVEALAELGGARSVEAVAFLLTDEEREVRRVAVSALGHMRGSDGNPLGVSHLVDLVRHSPDHELLAAAIHALGEAGDARALTVLKPLTRSAQPFVAVSAVESLARLSGAERVDWLLDGLRHPDAEVVKATMLALADAPDARGVPHIGACLDHQSWDVRRLAADLLGRISGEAALGVLRARLAHEDNPTVQEAIARSLERMAGIRRSVPPPMGSLRPR